MKKILSFTIVFIFVLFGAVSVKAAIVYNVPETYEQKIFEMRGAWVSTVFNIDIPRQYGTSEESIQNYKNEYLRILDTFEAYNMNTVFFQTRPCNDAFYQSKINSWSVYLAGQDGLDPGWDPLEWLIEVTHARGMEFHSWINPYRAAMDVLTDVLPENRDAAITAYLNTLGDKNFAKNNKDYLVKGGNRLLLNPGEPAVRNHLIATIAEIITNYDVDAIHFDDYFYTGVNFSEDEATYLEYKTGDMTQGDWRREQVDLLVEGVHDLIQTHNTTNSKSVEFGISPMSSISATYSGQYADVEKWVINDWLDYVVPQMYQALSSSYHKSRTATWLDVVRGTNVKLYMGLGSYNFSPDDAGWTYTDELIDTLRYQAQFPEVTGIFFFSSKNFVFPENLAMKTAVEKVATYWTHKTLGFDFSTVSSYDLTVPTLTAVRENRFVNLSFNEAGDALAYAIYAFEEGSAKEYTDSNIIKVLSAGPESFNFKVNAVAYKDYTYGVKIIYKDGVLSTGAEEAFTEKISGNIAPEFVSVNFSVNRTYFEYAELVRISGVADDANDDGVSIKISVSTNGRTYSYNYNVVVDGYNFSYLWRVPSLRSDNAKVKITVSDGLLETDYILENLKIRNYITGTVIILDTIQAINKNKFLEIIG